MTEFIYECYQVRRANLLEWRKRYKKSIYSSKVMMNLFYDLYSLMLFAKDADIEKYLLDTPINFSGLQDSMSFVIQKYRVIQVEIVAPKLQNYLTEYPMIFGLNWNDAQPLINYANNGNNKSVEEIEFTYIYNGTICQLSLIWVAHLLTGYHSREAYKTIVDRNISNNIISVNQLFKLLYKDIAYYFNANIKGKNLGFYEQLSNLW